MKANNSTFGLLSAALFLILWPGSSYAHPPGTWHICASAYDPTCADGPNSIMDSTLGKQVQLATTGLFTLSTDSAADTPREDIIVDPDAIITWTNANSLTLSAGEDISVDGVFTAAPGKLTLSVGQLGLGGTLNVNNSTTGVGTVIVTGGAGADTFNLNTGFSGSISGGSDVDTININSSVSHIGMNSIENVNLGAIANTSGSYTVDSSNTISTDAINVGLNGSGTLTLQNGGQVTSTDEYVGRNSGSTGTVNQRGGTNTATNLTLGDSSGGTGTYNLSGGTLKATNISLNPGGNFNFDGGTLAVDHFTGNLTNSGGTLAPGDSPGTTLITGDYTQLTGASYDAEIGGLLQGTEYDWLNVKGTATLGGTLAVDLFDLGSGIFDPTLGNSFDLLSADTIIGKFDSLELPTLANGLTWDLNYIYNDSGTDYVRLNVVASAVPEPSSLILLGVGLAGLGFVSRKKKAH